MSGKIMDILTEPKMGIESYNGHKYSLDITTQPVLEKPEAEICYKESGETSAKRSYTSIEDLANTYKNQESIFTLFLDGSRRVYKIDDVGIQRSDNKGKLIFPIVAGQIGVACCCRKNKEPHIEKYHSETVLVLPDLANANGTDNFFVPIVKKMNNLPLMKQLNMSIADILEYKTSKETDEKFEDRAIAQVQSRMSTIEKNMVATLVKEDKINQRNFLLKDGSLEYKITNAEREIKNKYQHEEFKNNYSCVLGISKNFNPSLCVDAKGKSNPGFIADLPEFHRTPAGCFTSEFTRSKFVIWYIRLRKKSYGQNPFDGVIKVEKMLQGENEKEDSEFIDNLSAYLLNERNPTCYGSDSRWANHLYPIYTTERYIKSKYMSSKSFLQLFS